jgi:hypothetical protein
VSEIDTSKEAVERLALSLQIAAQPITAATLRALLDERDAARALLESAEQAAADAEIDLTAARAEAARLREALEEIGQLVLRVDGGASVTSGGGLRRVRDILDAALGAAIETETSHD